jgi:hypothetical protein
MTTTLSEELPLTTEAATVVARVAGVRVVVRPDGRVLLELCPVAVVVAETKMVMAVTVRPAA